MIPTKETTHKWLSEWRFGQWHTSNGLQSYLQFNRHRQPAESGWQPARFSELGRCRRGHRHLPTDCGASIPGSHRDVIRPQRWLAGADPRPWRWLADWHTPARLHPFPFYGARMLMASTSALIGLPSRRKSLNYSYRCFRPLNAPLRSKNANNSPVSVPLRFISLIKSHWPCTESK